MFIITVNLQEVGCLEMDWIELAQDRDRCRGHVTAVMNLRIPRNEVNNLTGRTPVNFSIRTLLHRVN
jgi:hypothetical protein